MSEEIVLCGERLSDKNQKKLNHLVASWFTKNKKKLKHIAIKKKYFDYEDLIQDTMIRL